MRKMPTYLSEFMSNGKHGGGGELLSLDALEMDAVRVHGYTKRMCWALAARADVQAAYVEAERALARLRPLLARLQMAAGVAPVKKGGTHG